MRTSAILVDMDGVLADFDKQLWDKTPRAALDIQDPEDQTYRYLTDHCINKPAKKAMRNMVDGPGWFYDLPVMDGAQDAMNSMLNFGYDVWICTKPLDASATCASEKMAWVKKHFPRFHGRTIITPDKGLVQGRLLIDDAPKPKWLPYATWKPIIFSNVWNHTLLPYAPRIHSWLDFVPSDLENAYEFHF